MKLNFSAARKGDRAQLKKLWLESFDEREKAVDAFLDYAFKDARIFCCRADGEIVSALYLINASLKSRACHYLFAAATLKEYRGRGIMSRLIEYSLNEAEKAGDFYSLLLPAEKGLYDFYSRLCYKPVCFKSELCLTRSGFAEMSEPKKDFAETEYDDDFLQAVKKYYSVYSVRCIDKGGCFALFYEESGKARIIYYKCKDFSAFKEEILKNTSAESICIVTGGKSGEPHGMARQLNAVDALPKSVYIGLTLE